MSPRRAIRRAPSFRRLGAEPDTLTTSLVLPRRLHERLTLAATRLNCSLAQLIRDASEEFLRVHAQELEEARP